ncbi:MAG: hypothetical protein U0175_20050 [Caldilineaceae bacterium]
MMETQQVMAHWSAVAKAYHQTESPLHPSAEDIAIMERLVQQAATWVQPTALSPQRQALLLGVTPQIATMQWPPGTSLLAVDSAEGMVHSVWPGDQPGVRQAKLGDWLALPVADAACWLVIGDGSFNCLEFPTKFQALAAAVARVLPVGGGLVLRVYVQPARRPTPAELYAALLAGHFHTFDGFKFLLNLSLVDEQFNVAVREVWCHWAQAKLDQEAVLHVNGWSAERFATIAYYENSPARYSFPPLSAVECALADHFEKVASVVPTYPLGECCPILLLRKRM